MGTGNPATITVETIVHSPVESVWKFWTEPKHIMQWNNASDDWHTPYAENDLKAGGKFVSRMEAKDGSFGFDFGGVYDEVSMYETISYTMGDGRKVKISFIRQGNDTQIIESFDAEETNSMEMQQAGWQSILDNFKKYAENAKEE
ncbi:SRPBCC family protein [Brevibacillus invocatus]|uniref:SRPBCC family protein n=1 Tax=Brevibacillus invocatus TaxID=173959 RepID=UPI00203B209E|nr:SRPBCC family protein [Brevibacillus invocatus]MCM3079830.1 SRPBCC family protein [Brevibacillus invocatus]MCM3430023.1 SRPBCC family protein [Brevibacillus invocatus]